jgi:uncharacterized protein (TIGR02466 family)
MNITGFFPIPIGSKKLDNIVGEKEINYINKLKETSSQKNYAGNSISKNKHVLEEKELQNLKEILEKCINDYFREVFKNSENVKLYITNSWINWTKNGETHHLHYHPNSVASGVLYIDVCGEDTITFTNPSKNFFGNIGGLSESPSTWNAEIIGIPVIKNQMIAFPSQLQHQVLERPNTCAGTRTSLAFNTFIKGKLGGTENIDELILK